jgi:hypothetical protein
MARSAACRRSRLDASHGRTLWPTSTGALNEKDAARYIGVERKTLSNWRSTANGPLFSKTRFGHIRYYTSALEAWVARNAIGPAQPKSFPVFRITAGQAAKFLGVKNQVLTNWRRRGKGPAWKSLAGKVWYWLPDLREYALAHGIAVCADPEPSVMAVVPRPAADPKSFWASVDADFPPGEMSRAQK